MQISVTRSKAFTSLAPLLLIFTVFAVPEIFASLAPLRLISSVFDLGFWEVKMLIRLSVYKVKNNVLRINGLTN